MRGRDHLLHVLVLGLGATVVIARKLAERFPGIPERLVGLGGPKALLLGGLAVGLVAGARFAGTMAARARRAQGLETVEIVLSRDDTTDPFEVMGLFDNIHGLLAARYVGVFVGQPWAVWEMAKEPGDCVRFYLTAPAAVLPFIQARIQSTYQNVRFSPTGDRPRERYGYAQQFVLAEEWHAGLKTLKNYQNLISESLVAALDSSAGSACLQFVLIPSFVTSREIKTKVREVEGRRTSHRAQDPAHPGVGYVENKEFNRMLEGVGKKIFDVEIRLATDDWPSAQAVLGCLKEASADNELMPRFVWVARGWWFECFRNRVPGVRPVMRRARLASASLATLIQLPTVRTRVPLNRYSVRRGPAPREFPRVASEAEAIVREETGYLAFDEASRRYGILLLGVPGVGKSTVMLQLIRHDVQDRDKCVIVIDPKQDLARAALGMVPSDRYVVWLDVGDTGNGVSINPFRQVVSRPLLVDSLLASLKSVFGDDSIQARSDMILRAVMQLVIETLPDSGNLLSAYRALADPLYRGELVTKLQDPMLRLTWSQDIPALANKPGMLDEVMAAPKNKLWRFLSEEPLRRLFCGSNVLDWKEFIRRRGVLVINIPKGITGEENAKLTGSFLVSAIWQAVQAQASLSEQERVRIALHLDEAHNYLNPVLAKALAEGRAFGLEPVFAMQYLSQVEAGLRDAIKSLLQSTCVFRTESIEDAENFTKSTMRIYTNFIGVQDEVQDRINFSVDDYLNLPLYHAICRWALDGKLRPPFLAETLDWRRYYDAGLAEHHKADSSRRYPPSSVDMPEPTTGVVDPAAVTDSVGLASAQPVAGLDEAPAPTWAQEIARRLGKEDAAKAVVRICLRKGASAEQAARAVQEMEKTEKWRPGQVSDPLAVFSKFLAKTVQAKPAQKRTAAR